MNTKKAKKMDRMKRVAEGMKKNMPKKKIVGKKSGLTPKMPKVSKRSGMMFQDHMPSKKDRLKMIGR